MPKQGIQRSKTLGSSALQAFSPNEIATDADQKFQSHARSPAEKLYLRKLSHHEVYAEFLTSLAIDTGFSEDVLEGALKPLCLCCWQQARNVMKETEWSGDVVRLQAQVQELQGKLNLCNLSSMKAISNLSARKGGVNDAGAVEEITYHEPLAYLDPLTRELVAGIIVEKCAEIADSMAEAASGKNGGEVPPALAKLLSVAMEAKERYEEPTDVRKESMESSLEVNPQRRTSDTSRSRMIKEPENGDRRNSFVLDSNGFEQKKLNQKTSHSGDETGHDSRRSSVKESQRSPSKKKTAAQGGGVIAERGSAAQAAVASQVKPRGNTSSEVGQAARGGASAEDEEEMRRLKEEIKKHEEDAVRQKDAIKRLERALEESNTAAAQAATKLAKLQGKAGKAGQASKAAKTNSKGMPVADRAECEDEAPEVTLTESEHQAKKRAKQRKNNGAAGPQETQEIAIQTDLTGEYLQDIFHASAQLQATASNLGAQIAEAAADSNGNKKTSVNMKVVNSQTAASLQAMQLAHNVFMRLWDDALLRGRGIHRRQRAPASPKAEKLIRHTPELHAGEELIPELDIHGFQLDDPYSPKSDLPPSPKLGVEWQPRAVVAEDTPVLHKFVRQERKTVSLALLAPAARTTVETQMRQPLHDLPGNIESRAAPAQGDSIANVSDFLRRRREARGFQTSSPTFLPAANLSEGTGAKDAPKHFLIGIPTGNRTEEAGNVASKRSFMSRLGASASLPVLLPDT